MLQYALLPINNMYVLWAKNFGGNMNKTCIQCGKTFDFSKSEQDFYTEKNLAYPKRCPDCRRKNRIMGSTPKARQGIYRRRKNTSLLGGLSRGFKGSFTGIIAILVVLVAVIVGKDFSFFSNSTNTPTQALEYNSNNIGELVGFRSISLLEEHYKKHGIDMGFSSPEEYKLAANKVINNPATLHKLEKEDGDDIFYLEASNDLVVVSTDGYFRTYFRPDDKKAYFDRQ